MTSEYRQLQYELQCQEALLLLMQKLKSNQRISSQTNNNQQRTTVTTPVNAMKSNSSTPIKQPSVCTSLDRGMRTTEIFFCRIRRIDRLHLSHLIPINIQLIEQIMPIHSSKQLKFLCHYLKRLASQTIVHYQQQPFAYQRQHRRRRRRRQRVHLWHLQQVVLRKVFIYIHFIFNTWLELSDES